MGEVVFSWFFCLAVLQRYKLFRSLCRVFFLFLRLIWVSVWDWRTFLRSVFRPCHTVKRFLLRWNRLFCCIPLLCVIYARNFSLCWFEWTQTPRLFVRMCGEMTKHCGLFSPLFRLSNALILSDETFFIRIFCPPPVTFGPSRLYWRV